MKRVSLRIPKESPVELEAAYQTLRTNLLYGDPGKKVFLLTSQGEGEGKSLAAIRLAMSFAKNGQKVLLLDADLRDSKLAERIGESGTGLPGLAEFLMEQCIVEETVCSTEIKGFYLIPAGSCPKNPTELLSSERFRELIEILRRVFDIILIDTPPMGGGMVDASIAAVRADGALLVIEAGVQKGRQVRGVIRQLSLSHCPILGAVLTKTRGHVPLA